MKEIDLSIGAPSEPVSDAVLSQLAKASWQVGYPLAAGSEKFNSAVITWAKELLELEITHEQVMPVAGAKEFVGTLPWLLGLNESSVVAIPQLSYPTYSDGASATNCQILRYDSAAKLAAAKNIDLLWINSPNNPTGKILDEAELAALLKVAKEKQAVVVSDETYLETAIESKAASALGLAFKLNQTNVLGLYSLSKRNSLAAFRVGYAIGNEKLISELTQSRRKLGLLPNSPATEVASELLKDFSYPKKIREQFIARRAALLPILLEKGFINYSPGGMFLWLSNGEYDQVVVERFEKLKIKIAPGSWYGPLGKNFVRISLTLDNETAIDVINRLKKL
jgi:aspartate/methionine/tyrosine aminotransferase